MLNKVCIMGRLVRDPELRRTQSGYAVTTIRIAVDRDFRNKDGTRQADFFDVTAWQSTAEFISRYFTKGRMIIVDGRLQVREWTDREGNKRRSAEIVADNVYFGESKRRDEGSAPAGGYSRPEPRESYNAPSAPNGYDNVPKGPSAFAELEDGDGELPF